MQISEEQYSTLYHPLWHTQILAHKKLMYSLEPTSTEEIYFVWDSRNPPIKSAADELSS